MNTSTAHDYTNVLLTAKARGLTPLALFGTKADWAREAGAYPTQPDIDIGVYVADLAHKRTLPTAIEFVAWCLYARPGGASNEQIMIGTSGGRTQFNALNTFSKVTKNRKVFTFNHVDGAPKSCRQLVLLVTLPLPSAVAAPRKVSAKVKAAKAAKADAKVTAADVKAAAAAAKVTAKAAKADAAAA